MRERANRDATCAGSEAPLPWILRHLRQVIILANVLGFFFQFLHLELLANKCAFLLMVFISISKIWSWVRHRTSSILSVGKLGVLSFPGSSMGRRERSLFQSRWLSPGKSCITFCRCLPLHADCRGRLHSWLRYSSLEHLSQLKYTQIREAWVRCNLGQGVSNGPRIKSMLCDSAKIMALGHRGLLPKPHSLVFIKLRATASQYQWFGCLFPTIHTPPPPPTHL